MHGQGWGLRKFHGLSGWSIQGMVSKNGQKLQGKTVGDVSEFIDDQRIYMKIFVDAQQTKQNPRNASGGKKRKVVVDTDSE
ncbi:hypothetical protein AYI70_g12358 [Smittium culicis]|uniref:Uncharacterized protein n=1 Tax=Smittium culicis TaxID=133412 RepID=A0A1R1WXT5_9FUNG|nr:hypothetical protein AYI70_g12358 [Smittium culicis]